MDLIEACDKQPSLGELLRSFNEQSVSDYLVVYLRLVTSGYLQREEDFFQHFIEGGRTVREFCQQVTLNNASFLTDLCYNFEDANNFHPVLVEEPVLKWLCNILNQHVVLFWPGGGAHVQREWPHPHYSSGSGFKRVHPGGVHGSRRGGNSQSPHLPWRRRAQDFPPLPTGPLRRPVQITDLHLLLLRPRLFLCCDPKPVKCEHESRALNVAISGQNPLKTLGEF